MSAGVPLTIAMPGYHHARELVSGAVALAGVEPALVAPGAPGSDGADAIDMPLLDYLRAVENGDGGLTAVPVFLARSFAPARIDGATAAVWGDFADPDGEAFAATGIYPILTVLAVRRPVLDENRWLATNLYRAFEVARRRYFDRLADIRGSRVPIPSIAGHVVKLREILGPDLCPYGVEPNRATLEAFVAAAVAQGALDAPPADVADLFAPVEPFVDFTDGI